MRPLFTSLPDKLADIPFEFKKTEEMVQLAYAKAVSLSNKFGTKEK